MTFLDIFKFLLIFFFFILLQEAEEFLSNLVVNKTVTAKIDRLEGIVNFRQPKDPNNVLNEWSYNINKLMNLVGKTTHLITKEEMVHRAMKMA